MLILQSPLRPKSYGVDKGIIQLTQLFGENDLDYSLLGLSGHNGIDFRTKHFEEGNAPVLATHDGFISSDKNSQSDTGGRFVKIRSKEMEVNGKKCCIETVYFHLKSCRHEQFTEVKAGQLIGISDNTGGFTSGPHLHFGLYILWKGKGSEYFKDDKNGYGGAVNPLPYLIDGNVYQCGDSLFGRTFYYNGRKIKRSEVDVLIPVQYKT